MLTPRENMLRTIYNEKPEYVPLSYTEIQYGGFFVMNIIGQPLTPNTDAFGVPWIYGKEGGLPDPRRHPLDDIANWRKLLPEFPDLDAVDFKALAAAEKEKAGYDPKVKVYSIMDDGGPFMRLTYLLGISEACISMLEDPENVLDFFEAFTEWKIKYYNKIIDAYNPDIIVMGSDLATADSLFFSPELYRSMIKPFHKRIVEAVTSRDVIFDFHSCGKIESLIGDYVEIGAKMWQSAQPINDLNGILDRYQGKITVGGGWNTAGEASFLYEDTDEEVIRRETHRCLTTYKKPGYILWPLMYNDRGNARMVGDPRLHVLYEQWEEDRWF